MEYRIDWNCKLLPFENDPCTTAADAAYALELLHDQFGFSKFLMMSEWSMDHESIRAHQIRCAAMQNALSTTLAKTRKLKYATAAHLLPDLSKEIGLERLTLGAQRYLPILLPISAYEEWIDTELNALLYQRHFQLMFLSFDYAAILYPQSILEKLMRIPHAIYQFSIKSLEISTICDLVRTLLRKNATVVLGTGVAHPQKLTEYRAEQIEAAALCHLSKAELQTLLRGGRTFWASIHSPAVAR